MDISTHAPFISKERGGGNFLARRTKGNQSGEKEEGEGGGGEGEEGRCWQHGRCLECRVRNQRERERERKREREREREREMTHTNARCNTNVLLHEQDSFPLRTRRFCLLRFCQVVWASMQHRDQRNRMSKPQARAQRKTQEQSRQQKTAANEQNSEKTSISEEERGRRRARGVRVWTKGIVKKGEKGREQTGQKKKMQNIGEQILSTLREGRRCSRRTLAASPVVLRILLFAHQNLPRRLRMSESRGLWFVSTQSGTAVSSAQPPWYTEPYGTVMYCFANACSIDHQFELGAVCALASTLCGVVMCVCVCVCVRACGESHT